MKARLALLSLVVLVACKDEEVVKDDLWLYADRFYEEAAARNIVFDRSALTISFVPAAEIAPYAGYGNPNPPRVRFVKEYWDLMSPIQREMLMFHEIGHAVLERSHTPELLPNCSSFKSIMHADASKDVTKNYPSEDDPKRQYYLDELLNPYTSPPSWGGLKSNKVIIPLDLSQASFQLFDGTTDEGSVEADGAFHIFSHASSTTGNAFWSLPVSVADIPVGATLVLSFKVKTDLLQTPGSGPFVNLDPTLASGTTFRASTLFNGRIPINLSEYKAYQLYLSCYPDTRPELLVNLVLDGENAGHVWYKDVEVAYYE